MNPFPYIILNCVISLDGYLDDMSDKRLLLSNEKDFDRVDALRASCDAIVIGANTIRKDNPRLLIRSYQRQQERIAKGLPLHPIKVTVTSSGVLDRTFFFFTTGDSQKLIYTIDKTAKILTQELSSLATVIAMGYQRVALHTMLSDLYKRGVRRLLVEGGATILTQFLQSGLVNELQFGVAPFFVGEKNAPRFVQTGNFPWTNQHRLHLDSMQMIDDIAVLTYMVKK